LIGVLLTLAGFIATSLPPVVHRQSIRIDDLSAPFDQFRIVLLTDLHIGPGVGRRRIEQIVEITNELNAGK
jgi:predicted MPP superfamily phosphohydrolase